MVGIDSQASGPSPAQEYEIPTLLEGRRNDFGGTLTLPIILMAYTTRSIDRLVLLEVVPVEKAAPAVVAACA